MGPRGSWKLGRIQRFLDRVHCSDRGGGRYGDLGRSGPRAAVGEAAVVSYLLTADYQQEDGSIRTANYQMSTTLMMRDAQWKVVHIHFSAANPQGD